MSAVKQFTVLALASTVLAGQHAGNQHGHLHGRRQNLYTRPAGTGSGAPYAYPTANSTGIWGTTGYGSSTSVAAAEESPASYGNTYTVGNIHTEVVYSTITVNYPVSRAAEQCTPDVTVTNTEKVYVTVTAGQSASSSAEVSAVENTYIAAPYSTPVVNGAASSSSQAAPVSGAGSLSAAGYSAPAYSAPASSSDEASPVINTSAAGYSVPPYSAASSGSSTSVADTTNAAQYSSSTVPATSAPALSTSYAAASSQNTGTATASAPASYGSGSSSSGKRGLAYNDASLTTCFDGSSEISWAYNWESDSKGLSGLTYIPTLWGNGETYTSSWSSNAKSAIESGSTHLFSFNEPDHAEQANMDAATAAKAYKEYMNPFHGQAKLCAPSVTNGAEPMGLSWLSNFLTACDGGCNIDCINVHWYDSATNTDYFKEHLENATSLAAKYNIDTLYLSEFGATGSDDEVNTFLETVMPWMDSNSAIGGYAYFMVADGKLVSAGEPTTYGSTYKTYTSTNSSS